MEATKVIQCGIIGLTKTKMAILDREYENLQHFLQTGEDLGLHSANKQQAKRFYKVVKGGKEYPLSIRNDLLRIKDTNHRFARYWARIPNKFRRQLWVPLKTHQPFPETFKLRESKLVRRRDGNYILYVTISKDVGLKPFKNILAVDLGERNVATTVLLTQGSIHDPAFYGRNVRGIRRHYAWLRRRLQEKRRLGAVKRIGKKERRKVNAILHKVSRDIVDKAKESEAVIVLGDLKGIRNRARGKRLNRIVSNMPYYRLTQMISYKARWEGILIYTIKENNTSKLCHRCGKEGRRPTQGLFLCSNCGLEYNADVNSAINLAKRFSDYMLENGASVNMPLTNGTTEPWKPPI